MVTGDKESLPVNDDELTPIEGQRAIMVSSKDEGELFDALEDATVQVAEMAISEQSTEGLELKRQRVETSPLAIRIHEVSP